MKYVILALLVGACSATTPTAEQKKACVLPYGGLANHGEVKIAFKEAEAVKCESEMRTCNDGELSGSFQLSNCVEKVVNQEDPKKEKPFLTDAEGKKWGSVKEISSLSLWKIDGWPGDRPACPLDAALGKECTNTIQSCQLPDKTKLTCTTEKGYKVWGWVYEKEGLKLTPLEGVKVDQFWFVGCMQGGDLCTPMVPEVLTDKDGYFEYHTTNLLDQIRIVGKEGYFGICKDNKPKAGGGTSDLGVGRKTVGSVQYKLKPDSCVNGLP